MYSQSIGIIGGFGAYATLGFYRRLLETFASDSERNYPHIYMDNDFTMPSRTKALLENTGGGYFEIVQMIADSMRKLDNLGADYIVMVCGTAHTFLPDVYELVPHLRNKVLNIIDILADELETELIPEILIVAAEGTLEKKIYPQYLKKLKCINPTGEYYSEIRFFIESVKCNSMNETVYQKFIDFLEIFQCENVVLGCTEFPVLVDEIKKGRMASKMKQYRFYDPLDLTVKRLKKIMK